MLYHHSMVKGLMDFVRELHTFSPWIDQARFFKSLHRLVPYDNTVAFMKVDPATSQILPSPMTVWQADISVLLDHNDYFWQFKQAILEHIVKREFRTFHFPYIGEKYLPKAKFEEYQCDFWEKHHNPFSCGLYFKTRKGWFSLYLSRSLQSGDFTEEERNILDLLVPHLEMVLAAAEPETPTLFADPKGNIVCTGTELPATTRPAFIKRIQAALPNWIKWFLADPFKPLNVQVAEGDRKYRCFVSPAGTGQLPLFRITWEPIEESTPLPPKTLHLFSQKYRLSPREKEIVGLAVAGKQRKEMAQALGLSIDTVKEYLGATYRKVGVEGKGELVAKILTQIPRVHNKRDCPRELEETSFNPLF